MANITPAALSLSLAWEFAEVLPGYFQRDRKGMGHRRFPIVGPMPADGAKTPPLQNPMAKGPFLYALFDAAGAIKYVGKSREDKLFGRWVRPGTDGVKYWTHGTTSATQVSTVERIAEELQRSNGPVRLYFADYATLYPLLERRCLDVGADADELRSLSREDLIDELECCLIHQLRPAWNSTGKPPRGVIRHCGDYWQTPAL